MGKRRMEAFGDGALAIIITIMALGLAGPQRADPAGLWPACPGGGDVAHPRPPHREDPGPMTRGNREDAVCRVVATITMILGLASCAAPSSAALPPQLEPLSFLLGEWVSAGGGTPGAAQGSALFALSLQGRVLLRTSYAEYPASAAAPASRHDDLMVIYAAGDGAVRADYYDNEGHVIRYTVRVSSPGQASFVSEIVSGAPRYRLSYVLKPDGTLHGEFEIAPPGKPEAFAPYLAWDSHKAPAR